MDLHLALTHQAVRSLDGLTAFSARPDAPVLPVRSRRRRTSAGGLRKARGAPRPARFRPVTAAGHV